MDVCQIRRPRSAGSLLFERPHTRSHAKYLLHLRQAQNRLGVSALHQQGSISKPATAAAAFSVILRPPQREKGAVIPETDLKTLINSTSAETPAATSDPESFPIQKARRASADCS